MAETSLSQKQRNHSMPLSESRQDINLEVRHMEKCVQRRECSITWTHFLSTFTTCAVNFPVCSSYSQRKFKWYGLPDQVIQVSDKTLCYYENRKREYDASAPGHETNLNYNVVMWDGTKWRYDIEMTEANTEPPDLSSEQLPIQTWATERRH
jgi:hypothetical protein